MDDLTFGELFAGVGGFSLGFEQAGWVCRWQVEWDRHCQQVLARHWPEVARYGDVRDVAGGRVQMACDRQGGIRRDDRMLSDDHNQQRGRDAGSVLAPVTCITFGSPCQDLSVAGKRAGLDGARSGLFFEAIRIIKEMRNATDGTLPRFAIWENVAGALSSNKGNDFLAVLDAFAEIGAVDIAWRLVDAQHFGVPQRRRRVFVVADFGGESAGAIHVEPAGVRWHSASSGTAGEDVAGGVACGLGADSRVAGTLGTKSGGGRRDDIDNAGAYVVQEVVGTLSAGAHPGGFNGQDAYSGQLVVQPIPLQDGRDIEKRQNGLGIGQEGDPMYTIDQTGSQSVMQPFVKVIRSGARDEHGDLPPEVLRAEPVAPTLNAFDNNSDSRATVIIPITEILGMINMQGSKGNAVINDGNISFSLNAMHGHDVHAIVQPAVNVRRLTPLECERLMGWPDHHTRWRADGTEQSDSQRYRQAGNGVAAPCAAWLAWNLRTALETE